MKIQEILDRKGNQVYVIGPDITMREAAARIVAWNVGAVIVTDTDNALLGIISERDFLRALNKFGTGLLDLRVSVLMTTSVITCTPETTIGDALSLMGSHHIRHLPVVRDGQILGLMSIRDVLEFRLETLSEQDGGRHNDAAPLSNSTNSVASPT
jgi:CBS domain-containing protein